MSPGVEVELADTIPLRISSSQFWQPIVLSVSMTTFSLVAGSGFGSASYIWEYLTGDWYALECSPGLLPLV